MSLLTLALIGGHHLSPASFSLRRVSGLAWRHGAAWCASWLFLEVTAAHGPVFRSSSSSPMAGGRCKWWGFRALADRPGSICLGGAVAFFFFAVMRLIAFIIYSRQGAGLSFCWGSWPFFLLIELIPGPGATKYRIGAGGAISSRGFLTTIVQFLHGGSAGPFFPRHLLSKKSLPRSPRRTACQPKAVAQTASHVVARELFFFISSFGSLSVMKSPLWNMLVAIAPFPCHRRGRRSHPYVIERMSDHDFSVSGPLRRLSSSLSAASTLGRAAWLVWAGVRGHGRSFALGSDRSGCVRGNR